MPSAGTVQEAAPKTFFLCKDALFMKVKSTVFISKTVRILYPNKLKNK